MNNLTNLYRRNSYDNLKVASTENHNNTSYEKLKNKPPLLFIHRPSEDDDMSQEEEESRYKHPRNDESWNERSNASEYIDVPQNPRRARRTSDEPTMAEMMDAMVLSNLSGSPVMPYSNFGGLSSRNFDYNGVDGWNNSFQSFQQSARSHSAASLRQDCDDTMSEILTSKLSRLRNQEDESDGDSGTGLIRSPVLTPNKQEKLNDVDQFDDEPRDFTMKTLRAKEEAKARKQTELEGPEKNILNLKKEKSSSFSHPTAGIPIPPSCSLGVPNQFPMPYYNPLNLLHHSIPTGLANDVLLRIASTSPSHGLSTDFLRGASLPGHFENKTLRSMRRTAPYHKVNDDSAYSSPLRSGSPSRFTIGSAPASFHRLSNSGSYPGSHPLMSPSRLRKVTRSPSAPKYPAFPSPPLHNGFGIAMSPDGARYFFREPSGTYLKPVTQLSSSWNRDSKVPYTSSSTRHLSPKQEHIVYSKSNHVTSSKSLPFGIGRKVPGDGKKCRKVYGMENKAMWCTACRWKKACQRFPD